MYSAENSRQTQHISQKFCKIAWKGWKYRYGKITWRYTDTKNTKAKVQGDSEAILNPTTGQGGGGSRAQSDATATLNKISNIASILCAIDCTVYPVLLTILPILNAAGSAGAVAWLHTASHAAALWFVAPVGTTSVTANYLQHKRGFVFAWGLSGIFLVLLANVHLPHMIFGLTVPHSVGHALHANHSVINVLGYVFSNSELQRIFLNI